jgi:murein DD-endopeptidase MepM/ murein hydrolase activator NlpD
MIARIAGAGVVSLVLSGVVSLTGPATPAAAPVAAPVAAPASPSASDQHFRWPVDDPAVIVRPFDLPEEPWLAGHRGVDLAAPPGTTVYSPSAGVVTFVGKVVDRHLIVITHGDLRTTLEPVTYSVGLGQAVAEGEPVGVVSDEPAHAPNVVHWGVRRGDVYIDPALLVDPRPRAILLR